MAKRISSVVVLLILVFSLSISASARWDNAYRCVPTLDFSGHSISCAASITPTEATAKITASMVLYRVNSNGTLSTCATWPNKTGTGYLSLSGRYPSAQSGGTYRLVVTGTVKDNTGSHSISTYRQAKCP